MARMPRGALDDGCFHAFSRAVFQNVIFTDPADYQEFMEILGPTQRGFDWRVHAFCLMPTHFHLVLDTTVTALSRGMHRLKGLYADYFNHRYNRYGHVFASRFGAKSIDNETYYETVCRYVLENPVRAGLCNNAEDWPWSAKRF
jgi:REP element-mobilizing transposase RayT